MQEYQRRMFAEKLLDLANIAAGALVFGQFVSGQKVSISTFLFGIVLAIVFYFVSYLFSK